MDLVFLGTGGSVPTARRSTACLLAAARRRSADVRLRRGIPAPDAALDRARPGGRDLRHPPPRRPLPRDPGPAEDLRPRATASLPLRVLGPPGDRGAVQVAAADLRADRVRGRAGRAGGGGGDRATTGTRCARSGSSTGRAAYGYAIVEDERPGPLRPRGGRASVSQTGPDFKRLQDGEPVSGASGEVDAGAGDGRAAPGTQARDHRRHGALRDDPDRRPLAAAAGPRRSFADEEPGARPRPATRPRARPRTLAREAEVGCSPSSTSPRYDVARCWPRHERCSTAPSRLETSTWSRSRFPERGRPRAGRARARPAAAGPRDAARRGLISRAGRRRRRSRRRAARPGPPGGSAWRAAGSSRRRRARAARREAGRGPSAGSRSPQTIRAGQERCAKSLPRNRCLSSVSSKPRMIRRKRAPAIAVLEQRGCAPGPRPGRLAERSAIPWR